MHERGATGKTAGGGGTRSSSSHHSCNRSSTPAASQPSAAPHRTDSRRASPWAASRQHRASRTYCGVCQRLGGALARVVCGRLAAGDEDFDGGEALQQCKNLPDSHSVCAAGRANAAACCAQWQHAVALLSSRGAPARRTRCTAGGWCRGRSRWPRMARCLPERRPPG